MTLLVMGFDAQGVSRVSFEAYETTATDENLTR